MASCCAGACLCVVLPRRMRLLPATLALLLSQLPHTPLPLVHRWASIARPNTHLTCLSSRFCFCRSPHAGPQVLVPSRRRPGRGGGHAPGPAAPRCRGVPERHSHRLLRAVSWQWGQGQSCRQGGLWAGTGPRRHQWHALFRAVKACGGWHTCLGADDCPQLCAALSRAPTPSPCGVTHHLQVAAGPAAPGGAAALLLLQHLLLQEADREGG